MIVDLRTVFRSSHCHVRHKGYSRDVGNRGPAQMFSMGGGGGGEGQGERHFGVKHENIGVKHESIGEAGRNAVK